MPLTNSLGRVFAKAGGDGDGRCLKQATGAAPLKAWTVRNISRVELGVRREPVVLVNVLSDDDHFARRLLGKTLLTPRASAL
jgi:hypothetical protein